jgi:hypothetical protein
LHSDLEVRFAATAGPVGRWENTAVVTYVGFGSPASASVKVSVVSMLTAASSAPFKWSLQRCIRLVLAAVAKWCCLHVLCQLLRLMGPDSCALPL